MEHLSNILRLALFFVLLAAPVRAERFGLIDAVRVDADEYIGINHYDISGLEWTTSGHTGTVNTLAGFGGTGASSEVSTSAGLAGIITDETGTGALVLASTPTLITPIIGAATGTSLDIGGTSLFASRQLTVDTGGVFNINMGSASGDNFTISSSAFVVEGDTGNIGIGTTSPGAKLHAQAGASTDVGQIIKGAVSQSANLQEWQDSTGNINLAVNSSGDLSTDKWLASNTNTFLGVGSAGAGNLSHTTGSEGWYHTAVGYRALYSNTTGAFNTANGMYSLYSNTTGNNNTANGYQSFYSNTTGNKNTANGMYSLYSNTTGIHNTANGYQSLYSNTTGDYNTANGYRSLYDLGSAQTAGAFNVGTSYTIKTVGDTDFTLIGASENTAGIVFTATGVGTGTGTATPNATDNNTAFGYDTGRGIIYGTGNTIFGASVTGLDAGLTNNIILANGTGAIKAQNDGTDWIFTGKVVHTVPTTLKGYTVATLPAGVQGDTAFVTDATAPTYLGILTGGGAVVTPVFYDGTNWVSH